MQRNTLTTLATIGLLALAPLTACKDKKDGGNAKPTKPAVVDAAPAKPPTPPPAPVVDAAPAAPPVDPNADYIHVIGTHNPPKPTDPVIVNIEKFSVVKLDKLDPAKLEGASLELALDATSLTTDNEKRTAHLKSDSYLDVTKFGTITVKVGKVKKTGDKAYTAQAEISAHGVTVSKWPIAFEVVESTADSVRVKGSHDFKRSDFKIGQEEKGKTPETTDGTQQALKLEFQLTLKKS